MSRIYFHVDVNSAFLSWEAAWRLQHGDELDLRTVPSVVGGNQATRHGIVLAKSIPAKKLYNAQTGEPIYTLLQRAPNITVVPPRYDMYVRASQALMSLMGEYSPRVERFSIDEAFLDYTGMERCRGKAETAAREIADRAKEELGFTVNVGVSVNKLLAKMGSELTKPDKVHTMYPEEVSTKLWPLPVGDMYMIGRKTAARLENMGIYTVGALAKSDPELLRTAFKSWGIMMWNYANGRYEQSDKKGAANFCNMTEANPNEAKGMGNSTTIYFDVTDSVTANKVLLSLSESVGARLREAGYKAGKTTVSYCTWDFCRASLQHRYTFASNITDELYHRAAQLFSQLWNGAPIRQMGITVSDLVRTEQTQLSMLEDTYRLERVDKAVDGIRERFGDGAICRGCFVHSDIRPMVGGTNSDRRFPRVSNVIL